MLEDGECGVGKFVNQAYGSVNVKKVVVGNLLAVKLFEQVVEAAEERTGLMGILAIAQMLLVVKCNAQR